MAEKDIIKKLVNAIDEVDQLIHGKKFTMSGTLQCPTDCVWLHQGRCYNTHPTVDDAIRCEGGNGIWYMQKKEGERMSEREPTPAWVGLRDPDNRR